MDKRYYVYILATDSNTVLYVGVTNDLPRRIYEHKNGIFEGFTKKYNVKKLVYAEESGSITDAIAREKQIKKWRRSKKEALINAANPDWNELPLF